MNSKLTLQSKSSEIDVIVRKNIFKRTFGVVKEKLTQIHNSIFIKKQENTKVVLLKDKIPDVLIKHNSKIYRKFNIVFYILSALYLLNFLGLFIVNEEEFKFLHGFLVVSFVLLCCPFHFFILQFVLQKKQFFKDYLHLSSLSLLNILKESSPYLTEDEINKIKQILILPTNQKKNYILKNLCY